MHSAALWQHATQAVIITVQRLQLDRSCDDMTKNNMRINLWLSWLEGPWYSQPTRVQIPDLTMVLAFSWIYSRASGDMLSVGGDVPVEDEVMMLR